MKKISSFIGLVALGGACLSAPIAVAGDHVSASPPVWTFPAPLPAGNTRLIRSPQGLTAQFKTSGLTAGHTVTLWIMFFDNPEACAIPNECNFPGDVGRPGVRFDYHYAAGHIVNGSQTTLTGHLPVGELSTSGWAETGGPLEPAALTNPMGAQVVLAIHSHGPARTGQDLIDQVTSFLGGCDVFLGPGGFAGGFGDIPANDGECSTIQFAFHLSPGD